MNDENLIPASKKSKSEVRAMAHNGGIKSGIVRRQRKALRERLLAMGDAIVTNNGEKLEREDVIALQIAQKAAAGDLKAARLYAELTGQLAPQLIEIGAMTPVVIKDDGID